MEWWGYLTSGIGAAGGLYGAWRAWRTERRLRPSYSPWILRHHQNLAWELRSNLPTDALDVELEVVGHAVLHALEGDPARVPSGGVLIPKISARLTAPANLLDVSWRQGPLGRRRTVRLLIPPIPGT